MNDVSQVASVNVLHVPDRKYSLAARFVFQYLLTSQGNMYELKVHSVIRLPIICLNLFSWKKQHRETLKVFQVLKSLLSAEFNFTV